MSQKAVRTFYQKLADSPTLAARYAALTNRLWLWHSPAKIVHFAAMTGHTFTVAELEAARETNYYQKKAMLAFPKLITTHDYEPTAQPRAAEAPEALTRQ